MRRCSANLCKTSTEELQSAREVALKQSKLLISGTQSASIKHHDDRQREFKKENITISTRLWIMPMSLSLKPKAGMKLDA
ncbi:hypothetical protein DPMN_133742 [Dreissena polymorpha]|uniref:Uncharacterized protein n=1 Tax=Dreissena polymorpha TaxID=45954 RepID=A0A9D4FXM2_DREPO|nr:hypothetical protein DPMN_133742 [Dreissena polymorpha]